MNHAYIFGLCACEERADGWGRRVHTPVDLVPAAAGAGAADDRERAHGRVRREEVCELAGPAAEAAVRVLPLHDLVHEARAVRVVEADLEERKRLRGPVHEPRLAGVVRLVARGEALQERAREELRVRVPAQRQRAVCDRRELVLGCGLG
jgi:hypothetical protein